MNALKPEAEREQESTGLKGHPISAVATKQVHAKVELILWRDCHKDVPQGKIVGLERGEWANKLVERVDEPK